MKILMVKPEHDLKSICAQMQPEKWDKDNDMSSFNVASLRKFLDEKGILLVAYEGDQIVGDVMCYALAHPSGEDHFYVHELDTHPDYRRRGIGEALMQEAFKIAKDMGMTELWLGADDGNDPAHKLYQKLGPSGADDTTTYWYTIK